MPEGALELSTPFERALHGVELGSASPLLSTHSDCSKVESSAGQLEEPGTEFERKGPTREGAGQRILCRMRTDVGDRRDFKPSVSKGEKSESG